MIRILFAAVSGVIPLFLALPVIAESLDGMGSVQKKRYCLAYVHIDASIQLSEEKISQAQFNNVEKKISLKIMNKGDNFDYSNDFRRLNLAVDKIVDQDPTYQEFNSNLSKCKSYLRL